MKVSSCVLVLVAATVAPALLAAERTARENFKKHCVDCHGPDGQAKTRLGRKSGAKDLTDKAAMTKLSDDEIFKTIKFGRKNKQGEQKMDPFGEDLSDAEIRDLVAYVRTFSK